MVVQIQNQFLKTLSLFIFISMFSNCSTEQESSSRVSNDSTSGTPSGDGNPANKPTPTPTPDTTNGQTNAPAPTNSPSTLIPLDGTGTFSGTANGKSFTLANVYVRATGDSLGFYITHTNMNNYLELSSNCGGRPKNPQYENETDHRNIQVYVNKSNLNAIYSTYYFDESSNQILNVFNQNSSNITITEETATRVKATIHLVGSISNIQGTIDAPKCTP